MISRLTPRLRLAAPRLRLARRNCSTAARTDGFTEALPRGDWVAPLVFAGSWAFAWSMAEEGKLKPLVEAVEMNTDPNAWPTPKQLFSHFWPFVASTLGMLFESVACKFARTDDMRWLCVDAMNDDIKATVALGLLVAPAERSPAFLRAVCDHGTMRRTREIVQIYKTLPRDQHDDVLVNACIVLANVAKLSEPELRAQTLPVDDFVWMIPADKGHMYTTYALEGLAHTWRDDPGFAAGEFGQPAPSDGVAALLKSGGLARVAQYMDGPPLRPKQGGDAAILNQEVARRLFCRLAQRAEPLLAEARELERSIAKEHAGMSGRGGAGTPKTIWQRAGVHRGETELEASAAAAARLPAPPPAHHRARRRPSPPRVQVQHKQRLAQLDAIRAAIAALERHAPAAESRTLVEQYGAYLSAASAGALGAVYGGARAFARAWWQDVTPSVCRELAIHVSKRTALGCALLTLAFENSAALKAAALDALGKKEVTSYKADGALDQLIAIDAAYLGVIAVANFFFPYVLPCTFFNPVQLLIPPNDPAGFPTGAIEKA